MCVLAHSRRPPFLLSISLLWCNFAFVLCLLWVCRHIYPIFFFTFLFFSVLHIPFHSTHGPPQNCYNGVRFSVFLFFLALYSFYSISYRRAVTFTIQRVSSLATIKHTHSLVHSLSQSEMWWKVFCTLDIPIHLYMYQLYLKYHHKYTSIAVECGFVGVFFSTPNPIVAHSWAAFVILFMRLNSFQIHNNAFVISVCLFALSENAFIYVLILTHRTHTHKLNGNIREYVCAVSIWCYE